MNKNLKILSVIVTIIIIAMGVLVFATPEAEAKKTNEIKKDKKIKENQKKIKIIKNYKDKKIVRINGKNQTLKKYSIPGRYGAKVAYRNSKYIMITGAYCTCGRHKWQQSKTVIFENKVRYIKNSKEIPGKYYIQLNPKRVSDREFTVWNKGGRHHSVDLCLFCGKEKSQVGKSVNQFYMKRLC